MLCFCSILYQPYWLSLSLTVLLSSFWKNVVFLEMQILEGVIIVNPIRSATQNF